MLESWHDFMADDDAWIAVLTGRGPAFCAGLDVKERVASGAPGLGLPEIPVRDIYWHGEVDKPVIAAVNGVAMGGGFLLTSQADLRLAAPEATFQVIEVWRGGIGLYDAVLTAENLPYAIAAELLCGEPMTAERAYQVGFINRVVEPERLVDAALELARGLTQRPPLAVDYNLRILRRLRRLGVPDDVAQLGQRYLAELRGTADTKEAIAAFLERRPARFTRR